MGGVRGCRAREGTPFGRFGGEFPRRKLKQVGGTAFIAAFLEILLMVWVGYEMGRLFGWSAMDSIFLGAMLSISSTTIIVEALAELGKTKERFAQLIFGILITEDILAMAMIALLSGIAMSGELRLGDVGLTLGKLAVFLVASLVVGLLAVPRLLGYVTRFKSNEMLLVTVLGLCFGFSLLAAKLGYSVALGAFLIGAVIAESREVHRIENLIEPVRDMFSAVFFVAIGLLIDPRMLVTYGWPILVITLAVVVGKIVTCAFRTFVAGNDSRVSLRVGMGLAQIGGWLLRRSFIRVYSKAQVALRETLSQAPAPLHAPAMAVLPSLWREADLEVVALSADSPGVGKRTRELQLRTLTGASIVGIERNGGGIINPGPEEDLQAGDQVLLIGTRVQLDAARTALLPTGK